VRMLGHRRHQRAHAQHSPVSRRSRVTSIAPAGVQPSIIRVSGNSELTSTPHPPPVIRTVADGKRTILSSVVGPTSASGTLTTDSTIGRHP
jgi:hypothetical protein